MTWQLLGSVTYCHTQLNMVYACVVTQVLSESMVLLGLFSYVIPNDKAGPEWTTAQFEELQLLVCCDSIGFIYHM